MVGVLKQAVVQVAELAVAAFDLPLQAGGSDVYDVEHELRVTLAQKVAGNRQANHTRQHGGVNIDGGRSDAGAEQRASGLSAAGDEDAVGSRVARLTRWGLSSCRHAGSALDAAVRHDICNVDAGK